MFIIVLLILYTNGRFISSLLVLEFNLHIRFKRVSTSVGITYGKFEGKILLIHRNRDSSMVYWVQQLYSLRNWMRLFPRSYADAVNKLSSFSISNNVIQRQVHIPPTCNMSVNLCMGQKLSRGWLGAVNLLIKLSDYALVTFYFFHSAKSTLGLLPCPSGLHQSLQMMY